MEPVSIVATIAGIAIAATILTMLYLTGMSLREEHHRDWEHTST